MVKFISNVSQGLIVAIIFVLIIEFLVSNKSLKNYMKIISGIYIMIIFINPFFQLFGGEIDINAFKENLNSNEKDFITSKDMKEYYLTSFKAKIKSDLDDAGYKASKIDILLNLDGSEIEKLSIYGTDKINKENIIQFIVHEYGLESNKIFVE